ncbi:TrmH family RNA methyltransferase [Saccharicrinis aurantiacus]|uniref:TrmH family RNA methyltransferase n=1 Tax=Saccharicrinis aurantiacus TaxID=1849719 RepID=UPI00249361EE|nr:TrmH family RNA methyltransferase [Saccharicrinis aurantiacus]
MNTKSGELFSEIDYKLKEGSAYPIIIADQFRTPENMGHIIRLAANFACAKVLLVKEDSEVRLSKIKKIAGAAYGQVNWLFCSAHEIKTHLPDDYTVVGIETTKGSQNMHSSALPNKMALVLGNEVHGMSETLLNMCESFYHIPMPGVIKSMNVTQACCASLYAWSSQNVLEI